MAKKRKLSAFQPKHRRPPRRHQAAIPMAAAELCFVAGESIDIGMLSSAQVKVVTLSDGSEARVHPTYWNAEFEKHIVIADVVCGGGKQLGGVSFATTIVEGGLVDHVLIVTPNKRLGWQFVNDYTDDEWNPDTCAWPAVEENTNKSPILRDANGLKCVAVVTSHQALVSQPEFFRKEIEKIGGRWGMVLDEMHHLAENKCWHDVYHNILMLPQVKCMLGMSGTLRRYDGKRIPYVPYELRVVDGVEKLFAAPHIVYTRHEALKDQAIVPTRFTLVDGLVSWTDSDLKFPDGVRLSGDVDTGLNLGVKETRLAMWSALTGKDHSFIDAMIDMTVADWLESVEATGRITQMIFICVNREHATIVLNKVSRLLRSVKERLVVDRRFDGAFVDKRGDPADDKISAKKAVTRDPKKDQRGERDDSDDVVNAFQNEEFVALVTVAKAYEGMDAPCAKFICILSNKRSDLFKDQASSRGNRRLPARFATKWEEERCNVYMLCDRFSIEFVEKIKAEQRDGIEIVKVGGPGVPPPDGPRRHIEFFGGVADDTRTETVFPHDQVDGTTRPTFAIPQKMPAAVKASFRDELKSARTQIDNLCKELATVRNRKADQMKRHVETVVLGGRKLSSVGIDDLRRVLDWLRSHSAFGKKG